MNETKLIDILIQANTQVIYLKKWLNTKLSIYLGINNHSFSS